MKPTNEERLASFKKMVGLARDNRLSGNLREAVLWDGAIEVIYRQGHFDQDFLFEIESDIRADL
tara:strand:- start:413 stop:604 length:192 start_codon:yes stop_codon:yes gene_type:complete